MKTFVVGDIHGRIEALKEVLTLSNFDYDNDKLILLGDIADGGYEVYECVEELLKIKNLVFIIGNHDVWFMNYMKSGWSADIWQSQGGKNTVESYAKFNYNIPVTHQEFFNNGIFYYIQDNKLFVHGGYDTKYPIEQQTQHDLTWDRELIERCKNGLKIKEYDKVFVGHTPTSNRGWYQPIRYGKLIMMDCGAGWDGRLAIMNIDTEEFWVSKLQTPAGRK
jgi:serine/threonine protein phosphatase 1